MVPGENSNLRYSQGRPGGRASPRAATESPAIKKDLIEGLLTRCPATWSELFGLESLQDANDLVHVASYAEVVNSNPTDRVAWINDVGRSKTDTSVLVKDAKVR